MTGLCVAVCSCVEGGSRGLLALVSSHLSITTFVPASGLRDHWAEGDFGISHITPHFLTWSMGWSVSVGAEESVKRG